MPSSFSNEEMLMHSCHSSEIIIIQISASSETGNHQFFAFRWFDLPILTQVAKCTDNYIAFPFLEDFITTRYASKSGVNKQRGRNCGYKSPCQYRIRKQNQATLGRNPDKFNFQQRNMITSSKDS